MVTAFETFLARYPDYASTRAIDELRATDYGRLDAQGHAYLDYTGGSLYAASQVREHTDLLNEHVFGNPHSGSPSSSAMTALVEQTRRDVLDFFNAAGEYTAIFTLNASGALKLVGESYPFGPDARLLLSTDNHNSVNGIREFARAKGADGRLRAAHGPRARSRSAAPGSPARPGPARTAPACSRSPRSRTSPASSTHWSSSNSAHASGWDVLLDAAAFVPSNKLDLSIVKPDLVAMSFYKMFGYPTGVGCLLVRKAMLSKLARPWFAGGTVNFVSVQARVHVLAKDEAGFEDGTLNYLSIPAVSIGLRHLQRVGLDADPAAGAAPHRMADRRAAGAPPRQRPAAGPHVRPGDDGLPRRHGDDELLRSRRPPDRLSPRRRAGRRRSGFRFAPAASATLAAARRPRESPKPT